MKLAKIWVVVATRSAFPPSSVSTKLGALIGGASGVLSEAVVEAQLVEAISARTVGRILSQAQIKPHRVKMWCHSEDLRFQEKLRDIVRLYIETPAGEPVLCVDEKSGMQVLSLLDR